MTNRKHSWVTFQTPGPDKISVEVCSQCGVTRSFASTMSDCSVIQQLQCEAGEQNRDTNWESVIDRQDGERITDFSYV